MPEGPHITWVSDRQQQSAGACHRTQGALSAATATRCRCLPQDTGALSAATATRCRCLPQDAGTLSAGTDASGDRL